MYSFFQLRINRKSIGSLKKASGNSVFEISAGLKTTGMAGPRGWDPALRLICQSFYIAPSAGPPLGITWLTVCIH